MINFIGGLFIGTMLLEPIIINTIYMSNVKLFNDIMLNKKSSEKLRRYYNENK